MLTIALAWLALAVLTTAAWSYWRRAERVYESGYVPWLDREEESWTDDGELDGYNGRDSA